MIGLKNMKSSSLILDLGIYSNEAVSMACSAYADLADIEVSYTTLFAHVTFGRCKYSLEATQNEFENYLISLMNVRGWNGNS